MGSEKQRYFIYFGRKEVQAQWEYRTANEVKAVNGFSCVTKKKKPHNRVENLQRKLFMDNGANYWFCDCTLESRAVPGAGETLGNLYSHADQSSLSQWDEEQCFSYGYNLVWMRAWLAVPPFQIKYLSQAVFPREEFACKYGHSPDPEMRIYPCYNRWPVGSVTLSG